MGQMSHDAITKVEQDFQTLKTKRKVIVATIKSATSLTLTQAKAAYFFGFEWDFNPNEQAEDRVDRLGQTEEVRCYYAMHEDTIDEHVMEVISTKHQGAKLILSPQHLLPARYRK
jgi:DNA repair protein RAD5